MSKLNRLIKNYHEALTNLNNKRNEYFKEVEEVNVFDQRESTPLTKMKISIIRRKNQKRCRDAKREYQNAQREFSKAYSELFCFLKDRGKNNG